MWKYVLSMIGVQMTLFFFAYYSCYDFVYPASKIASNLNTSLGWFIMAKWAFAAITLVPNCLVVLRIFIFMSTFLRKRCPTLLAWFALSIWLVLCVWICTWGVWLSWPLGELWHKYVWEHSCEGWSRPSPPSPG